MAVAVVSRHRWSIAAFTLIELSIVLVIIGLIVGGILVGQDLIKNAEVRAQISQIEKYNQAVNTFRGKFGGLPGDLATGAANQFGFVTTGCPGTPGFRDGNGLIDGQSRPNIYDQTVGETFMFWADISSPVAGNLIDTQITNSGAPAATCNYIAVNLSTTPGTTYVGDYFPSARIGHGNFLYVYEASGFNWFGLSAVTSVNGATLNSSATIPVVQAYDMDKKVDDGLPVSGGVQAVYISGSQTSTAVPVNAAADTTTTCYSTTSNAYSLSTYANYGAGGNCALSFRFQ